MRVYTIHLHSPVRDPDDDIVLVEEGFSWGAAVFSPLWALWRRLWLVAVGLVIADAALSAVLSLVGLDPAGRAVAVVGFAALVGFLARDLERWTLGRRGYEETGVVAAPCRESAEQRFYDHRPDIVRGLVP